MAEYIPLHNIAKKWPKSIVAFGNKFAMVNTTLLY